MWANRARSRPVRVPAPGETKLILTTALATRSHLIAIEMKAARRWLRAYSAASVNELNALRSVGVFADGKIWSMAIKPA